MTAVRDVLANDVLAIDLGSSFVKLGWFRGGGGCASPPAESALHIAAPPLPTPDEATRVAHRGRDVQAWVGDIERWLDEAPVEPGSWCLVGSVHPPRAESLVARLEQRGFARVELLRAQDLPLDIRTAEPARVGIDRVLDAVAVNRLRRPGTPAVVVDMGTAITVDLVAADGGFEGGAILAGPVLALGALHAGTATLPALDLSGATEPPSSVGKSTEQALLAGAYWSAAGGVRELVRRTAAAAGGDAEFYLTGGGAPGYATVLELNGRPPRHLPHLALSGIRLVAGELAQ
jgi:type III pantothenate kinase